MKTMRMEGWRTEEEEVVRSNRRKRMMSQHVNPQAELSAMQAKWSAVQRERVLNGAPAAMVTLRTALLADSKRCTEINAALLSAAAFRAPNAA